MRTNMKLPPGETQRLLELYAQTGAPEYRDRVVEAHLYIAEIIARRFSGRGVDYEDLFQVEALALTKALERFDTGRGIQFASFVTPAMVGEVKNYFRDRSRAIRPPRRAMELARLVDATREKLIQRLGRAPRVDELAGEAGLTEDEVLEGLEAASVQPVSLDQQIEGEDGEAALSGVLGAEEKGFADFETADLLRRSMDALTPQQREVIRLRYFENLSQREVALRTGVSQMTVSRTERGALERMRRGLKAENE